jgi:hypothetical protein
MLLYNGLLYDMMKSRRINKRKKYTRRFRVRSRIRTRKNNHKNSVMKGGLRRSDCINIGLTNAYRFMNHPDHANLLRGYMFGSKLQEDAWMGLLRECLDQNVPVYILTSGNKIGVIRMLQLALLDKYITEVLCTHPEFNVNPLNRGDTPPTHNFHGQDKYEVITTIVIEHGLSLERKPDKLPIGYFLDDDEGNFEYAAMCSSIQPVLVLSEGTVPPDFNNGAELKQNAIYKLNVEDLELAGIESDNPDFNFTPIDTIHKIMTDVKSGAVRILFLDFDKTLQIHNSAISFDNIRVVDIFGKKKIRINDSAPYPKDPKE